MRFAALDRHEYFGRRTTLPGEELLLSRSRYTAVHQWHSSLAISPITCRRKAGREREICAKRSAAPASSTVLWDIID